jgi:hypothetical protein
MLLSAENVSKTFGSLRALRAPTSRSMKARSSA